MDWGRAKMSKEKDPDQDLLFKIYENLIRTEEKLKALIESNQKEHGFLKEHIEKVSKLSEELDKRMDDVEKKGFALTWTWKLAIFLFGAIPTILTILKFAGFL